MYTFIIKKYIFIGDFTSQVCCFKKLYTKKKNKMKCYCPSWVLYMGLSKTATLPRTSEMSMMFHNHIVFQPINVGSWNRSTNTVLLVTSQKHLARCNNCSLISCCPHQSVIKCSKSDEIVLICRRLLCQYLHYFMCRIFKS